MSKLPPSLGAIILHAGIALVLSAIGVYVFLEKRMLVAGKLTGGIYQLESPAHIILALSLLMLGGFFLLALVQSEFMNSVCQWLFIGSMVLFGIGLFIS